MPDDALLEIDDLCVAYDGSNALNGVSLRIGKGELICVVGANGAGKTSLIRSIAGIVPSSRGSVRINGVEISRRPPWDICEMGIAQVAEGRQIFSALSVEDNLLIGGSLKRARHDLANTLDSVYQLFGRLRERRDQLAGTLSGGEQQMLAIGRAIMSKPEIVMFDEPSIGLSPALTDVMFGVVKSLNEQGITVLLVEQNVAKSLAMSSRGYVLENGSVVLHGSSRDLLENPDVQRAYLGL
ncbi:branched-chain amino acid transport system ATP-binding protein [Bradyrhizobium sp. JR7.2]|jgi:branched-chain amino acid transport system ATP-binding protein|uniref:ABC transporter ATP-binding protein n=1 Tax=Bradyrhizobium barranii TaxID=2992140 RepID=A0ABY3QEY2_9BRAD|nr:MULTISPECIES: ATP-binding cassette domain-containing protein [Bradyrhizobium]EIG57957.1 ABC-type branched-chain amino acid transport system, ATPase component [Bradyrhizobium sp. WSM1253]MBW5433766.1 ABC transporter ATP-binding protein [Bradyrhizobium canariense]UFW84514.1 ABC transporter ATP-binding protein [Bradyrhizobium japonicum]UPJ57001.1 ABC transporter ATP-binding protein [Bradyrhizobium sp. 192]WFT92914.1 ABC transporter ATP-binding protein [Bradyrhizobium barranii]